MLSVKKLKGETMTPEKQKAIEVLKRLVYSVDDEEAHNAIGLAISSIQREVRLEEALKEIKETAVIHRDTLNNIRHIIVLAKQALSEEDK